MSKTGTTAARPIAETRPHRLSVPRFITDEDIGLGDVIKRVTSAFGVHSCGGCERRAAALNRWLQFSRKGRE
jgi:hypothetical protein